MSEEDRPQRDVLEAVIVHCWESVLRHRPIGVEDNFFALGGHSLPAMRVAGRLRTSLGVPIDYAMVLEHLTVASLARALRDSAGTPSQLDDAGRVYLSEHGITV